MKPKLYQGRDKWLGEFEYGGHLFDVLYDPWNNEVIKIFMIVDGPFISDDLEVTERVNDDFKAHCKRRVEDRNVAREKEYDGDDAA